MWRMYACGWFAYLCLLVMALQLDDLRNGSFNWGVIGQVIWTAPQAAILALLWPLSGWLERKRPPPALEFLLHGFNAALYAVGSYVLLSLEKIEARSVTYQMLNVLGAAGFIINSGINGALPSAALNVIWMGIGVYALWHMRKSD